ERLYRGFISDTPSHTFFHGHSFTANPLGCAAALASLDLLQHNPERYQQFEARQRPLLEQLSGQPLVKRLRCLGTMAAFEVEAGAASYLNPVGRQIQRLCLEQGVFLRPLGNVVYVLPPLGISDAQLQRVYDALRNALAQLTS
ncbi:MAG: aminotransferase class III-fold pyridoxal phosphate-dependent enzyme, partial [Betaproteobacteria bacterium]|nr:aminotransferase class III-fold pyridoxal phosphate-dependent enzyme [Betaproteobacteria bacterium]